jgi:hypothetical protein
MEADKPDSTSKGRRRRPNEEWATHTKLAWMLQTRLDPQAVFWTSLENKPSSRLNGFLQKRRGVRGGFRIYCSSSAFLTRSFGSK